MEKLYINIPIDVKLKIDKLFNLKQKQLDKIYFLIWKINTEGIHQLNIHNYTRLLGWKTSQLINTLSTLVAEGLIFKAQNYLAGSRSNAYSLVNRFNISSTDYQLKYNSQFDDLPIWVQRYCSDGGTARGKSRRQSGVIKEFSNFKKVVKKSTPNTEIEALKSEVERLKELLKAHNIQFDKISPLETSKEKDEVVVEEDEKLAVKPDNELLELNDDGSFEIILKSKNYYFQNFNKVKQLANDEDEVYGFAQRFMMQSSPVGKVTIKDKVFGYQWAKEENDMMILID